MQSNQYMHENLISGLQQDEEKSEKKGKDAMDIAFIIMSWMACTSRSEEKE